MHGIHPTLVRTGAALVASLLSVASIGSLRQSGTVQASTDRPSPTQVPQASTLRTADTLAALPLNCDPRMQDGAATVVARGQG